MEIVVWIVFSLIIVLFWYIYWDFYKKDKALHEEWGRGKPLPPFYRLPSMLIFVTVFCGSVCLIYMMLSLPYSEAFNKAIYGGVPSVDEVAGCGFLEEIRGVKWNR